MGSIRNKLLRFVIRRSFEQKANLSIPDLRRSFEQDCEKFTKPAKDTIVKQVELSNCSAEWIGIKNIDTSKTILYFHGGGYIIGSAKSHRNMVSKLCHQSKANALSVNYRLAPESPFPAAIDDGEEAYKWLLENGHSPEDIVIAGDSAGANLALTVLFRMRSQNLPLPNGLVLISPWTDLTHSGASIESNKHSDPMVKLSTLGGWAQLYAQDKDLKDPMLSPCFGNLSDFPPMYVCVSSSEILFSDAEDLVKKAKAEGVKVTFEVGDNVLHVWPLFNDTIPEGKKAIRQISSFIGFCLSASKDQKKTA